MANEADAPRPEGEPHRPPPTESFVRPHSDGEVPGIKGREEREGNDGSARDYPKLPGYEVTGLLGEGGMGTVWRAIQLGTRRDVALKLIGQRAVLSRKGQLRFEREVELAAQLEHPNIARVYESGLHQGLHYYAMELVDGAPLDEYVKANDLPAHAIVELVLPICRDVERLCPNAFVLNFTNPESRVTMAMAYLTKVRAVGLCHGQLSARAKVAEILGRPLEDLDIVGAGLNHLFWMPQILRKELH